MREGGHFVPLVTASQTAAARLTATQRAQQFPSGSGRDLEKV